jgi:uncharacterized membrane-anchored protein YitT (DUF2179 family)
VGRKFIFFSLAGALMLSLAISFIEIRIPVDNMVAAAILAGIIIGTGAGLLMRSQGSAGGVDILSIVLLKQFSIRLGSTVFASNVLIIGMGVPLVNLDTAIYTLICIFVTSKVINLMVSGLSQRKAVTIISSKWDEIRLEIVEELNRGVTIIAAKGGYSRGEEVVLYTVVTFRELARLKKAVKRIDPDAFLVVTDTLEVMGLGVGNQPHW